MTSHTIEDKDSIILAKCNVVGVVESATDGLV